MPKRFDLQRPNLICNTCEGAVFSRGSATPHPRGGVSKSFGTHCICLNGIRKGSHLFPVANVVNYHLIDTWYNMVQHIENNTIVIYSPPTFIFAIGFGFTGCGLPSVSEIN